MASDDAYELVAIITPKKEKRERAVELLKELAEGVQANETGALKYQLCYDRNQGDELFVLEKFKNKAAYEAHNDAEHFKKVGKAIEEEGILAKSLEVKVLGALAGFANR